MQYICSLFYEVEVHDFNLPVISEKQKNSNYSARSSFLLNLFFTKYIFFFKNKRKRSLKSGSNLENTHKCLHEKFDHFQI